MTGDKVIIDHTGRLHVRITDGRADKAKAILPELLRHVVGLFCRRRYLVQAAITILNRLMIHELPDVIRETTQAVTDIQKGPRIADRACHFKAITHNSRVFEQFFYPGRSVAGHLPGIKFIESCSIARTLVQDGAPGQARLGAFQNQEFKQGPVVPGGQAPLLIVIPLVQGVTQAPATSFWFDHLWQRPMQAQISSEVI